MPNIICSLRNNHQESHFVSAPSPFLIQCQAQRTLSLLEATMNHDTSNFFVQNVLVNHVCLALHVAWDWFVATILVNELSEYEFRTYGTRYRGSILASTRTSDRAGRVRAPTHAHPVFDDKISTPTRPARAKNQNGRPPAHWASASATRPPTRPKGKRPKVVLGARSPHGKHPETQKQWGSYPDLRTQNRYGYHWTTTTCKEVQI